MCDFTQTCLGMIIPHYEKCPDCPPTSHLVDKPTHTLNPFAIRLAPIAYHNAYIYKYFIRYILLCIYIWTLILIYFLGLKCSENYIGIVVSYPREPCGIRFARRPVMRPLHAKLVDMVDTFKIIHYTTHIQTNTERIRLCSQMTNKNML